MARGPCATKIVVIHRRQIVMYEAIDLYELDGCRAQVEMIHGSTERFTGGVHEHGPQALSTTKHAVSHAFAKPRCAGFGQREAAVEHLLDSRLVSGEPIDHQSPATVGSSA